MSDHHDDTGGGDADRDAPAGAPSGPARRLQLTVRELPLKQAPMEAVIRRET